MLKNAAQLSDDELAQAVFDLFVASFEAQARADPSVILRRRPLALHVVRRGGLLTVKRGEGPTLLAGDFHTRQHPNDNAQPIPISVVRHPIRREFVIWEAYTPAVSPQALVDDIVKTFLDHTSGGED